MDLDRHPVDHRSLADRRTTIQANTIRVGIVVAGLILALGAFLYRTLLT